MDRSCAHTPDHSCTHTPAYARTHTLSPSLLLAASLHPLTGKRGATISVVFWFWLGSARGSSGSGVLKTAEVSPACVPLLLLLLLSSCPLCFFFVLIVVVADDDASRSRVFRGTVLVSALASSSSFHRGHRRRRRRYRVLADILVVREFAAVTFPEKKSPPLSLSLSPSPPLFPYPEGETATLFDRKTEPAALLRLPAAIVSPRLL